MTNSFEELCEKVRLEYDQLDDNLLAALIVASIDKRHLVIQTKKPSHVRVSLQYLAEEVLGFRGSNRTLAVHCAAEMTWHQLAKSILVEGNTENGETDMRSTAIKVPSFLIIENLDKASKLVQTMMVSTLVERKFVVNKKIYQLPDDFVLIIIGHGRNLVPHLRDYMLLEHVVEINYDDYHSTVDKGVEERTGREMRNTKATTSAITINEEQTESQNTSSSLPEKEIGEIGNQVRHLPYLIPPKSQPSSTYNLISKNRHRILPNIPQPHATIPSTQSFLISVAVKIPQITISASIQRYMQNIVIALRTHRLIRSGVSPRAVKDFNYLVRALSVLHDYEFVTPSIVSISARKLFPLRIQLCNPTDEPSLNYGGDIDLVSQWMMKWDEELVIEDILTNVPCAM